jgi:hypothetical protein
MGKIASDLFFGDQLCRALGLDSGLVTNIRFEIDTLEPGPVTFQVTMVMTDEAGKALIDQVSHCVLTEIKQFVLEDKPECNTP